MLKAENVRKLLAHSLEPGHCSKKAWVPPRTKAAALLSDRDRDCFKRAKWSCSALPKLRLPTVPQFFTFCWL